jgi:hypothetical protein
MANVDYPSVQISVYVEREELARCTFYQTHRSPQAWEVSAAISDRDARQAIRSCLLAFVAEIASGEWDTADIVFESGSETDDQLQLPWS